MMPLSLCDKDTPLQIAKITGGEKMRTRLAELGFFPQAKLVVRQENRRKSDCRSERNPSGDRCVDWPDAF